MQLLKIGGNELSEPGFLESLAGIVARIDEPVVIVHGGGRAIADMQERLGLEPVKVDGLRVTDAESLAISQMVLSGQANKAIVVALLAAGVQAVGLSGVDGGLLRCVKKQHPTTDLGYVGQIVETRPAILSGLIAQGIRPVISPISLGLEGQVYNVNADEAAGALAAALGVRVVSFISNVPAVLDEEERPISSLTAQQTELLIEQGVIHSGMVPKVRAALAVIEQGVPRARIVNLNGLAADSGTLFQ
ncbi:MAG TPA: acetylglutamate kinase [Anaerolineae bacterium]|jgi:acetylglutamate kinase|nr:acetylglutamate kinase [Anaerolineae bacterium]